MPYRFSPELLLNYFLKRESTQFFISVAIRYLALGMVGIFEPIYIYLFFEKSLTFTLLFFAAIYGLFGILVVFGGKLMAKIGLKHTMLVSHFFFFGYYLCLFFLSWHFSFIILAIFLRAFGMILFWPAFHTDFVRFSERDHRAMQIGKLNAICPIASIVSPVIGGLILQNFGYLVLFVVVLITLFASAFPLFLSKERHEIYTDSYKKAWQRIFKNKNTSLALAFQGIEGGVAIYLWPIFMFLIGINYGKIGGITSFSLGVAALFALYMGKLAQRKEKGRILGVGSFLLSIAWIIKCFVKDALSAFLAQTFYRISRNSATIPFQAIIYEKASLKGAEADEFLIYREIILNITKLFSFLILAGIFYIFSEPRFGFLIAGLSALGLIFVIPKKLKKEYKK
jgi:MFS family permease